jgi:hypothetical protein
VRAAAALARFEVKEGPQIEDEDLMTDGETESDTEKDGPCMYLLRKPLATPGIIVRC